MTIDIEQAARDLSSCLGLPPGLANIHAQCDRRGAYISVQIVPEFLGRLAMPPVFKGYPVAVSQRKQ